MKLTVEVEIDWIDEDGTIDEEVSDELKEQLAEILARRVRHDAEETIARNVERHVNQWLNGHLEACALKIKGFRNITVKDRIDLEVGNFFEGLSQEDGLDPVLDRLIARRMLEYEGYVSSKIEESVRRYFNPRTQSRIEDSIIRKLKEAAEWPKVG